MGGRGGDLRGREGRRTRRVKGRESCNEDHGCLKGKEIRLQEDLTRDDLAIVVRAASSLGTKTARHHQQV